jgi:hypothetical protein
VLDGSISQNNRLLRWAIESDGEVLKQVLEASVDGTSFHSVHEPGAAERQWQHNAPEAVSMHYRLRIWLRDGGEHESNTILLRNIQDKTSKPHLSASLVNGSEVMMVSPVAYQFILSDVNGRVITRGKAQYGRTSLPVHHLSPGIYLVQFSWDGGNFVEKMVKK